MKKILTTLLLCCCFCFLLNGCKSNDKQPNDPNLSQLKTEDVTSFLVTLRPPDDQFTITDEQAISELVDILNEVKVLEEDNSYTDYDGQWVEFELTMTDGSSNTIATYNPFIIIDGVGYKTESEPCAKLNSFGNDFSDNSPWYLEPECQLLYFL